MTQQLLPQTRVRSTAVTVGPADFATSHQIEPELLGKRPRKIEYIKSIRMARPVLWNVCATLLLGLFYMMTVKVQTLDQLLHQGRRVEASVTANETVTNYESGTSYSNIDYQFSVGGRQIEDWVQIAPSSRIGKTIRVTYLPADPTQHYVGEVTPERVQAVRQFWLYRGSAAGVVCFVLIVGIELALIKASYLLRQGIPVPALVIRCRSSNYKDTHSYHLDYKYPGLDRRLHQSTLSLNRWEYEHFKEGDTFTLLRHPDDVHEVKPYFQFTVVQVPGAQRAKWPTV